MKTRCTPSAFQIITTMLIALFISLNGYASSTQMTRVGQAEMKILFWQIYRSSLFTHTGSYHKDERPIKLEIKYLRDIKARDLLRQTAREWQHLGLKKVTYQPWLDKLEKIWPDIKENDRLAIEIDQRNISHFYFNDYPIATLKDQQFGSQFLAIWLSEKTSQPEHRLALIGETR
jgi:hypothetical protein